MPIWIEIGSFVIVFESWRSQFGNRRTTERTNRRTDEGTGREHTVHTRSHKVSQTMGTGVRYYVCVFLWCWARSVSDS